MQNLLSSEWMYGAERFVLILRITKHSQIVKFMFFSNTVSFCEKIVSFLSENLAAWRFSPDASPGTNWQVVIKGVIGDIAKP